MLALKILSNLFGLAAVIIGLYTAGVEKLCRTEAITEWFKANLEITEPGQKLRTYPIQSNEIVLGRRSRRSDISFTSTYVSRQAARILYQNGCFWIYPMITKGHMSELSAQNGQRIDMNGMKLRYDCPVRLGAREGGVRMTLKRGG